MQVKVNNVAFPLLFSTGAQETMLGHKRDVVTLTIEASYAEAADNFVKDVAFTIVDDDGKEYVHDEYPTPGAITDNRDGTVVVKMGAANTKEQDLENKVAAAEAETAKVSQSLVTLAGKPIQESEVSSLRASFENAANKLSDDDAKIAPSLTTAWNMGQQVSTGQRRYYAPDGNLYKALQDHTTSISTFPDTATDYWVKL